MVAVWTTIFDQVNMSGETIVDERGEVGMTFVEAGGTSLI
jgi:hypothetical protein